MDGLELRAEIKEWRRVNDPGFVHNWTGNRNFAVRYNTDTKEWEPILHSQPALNAFYFSSRDVEEAFINHFGDRLKLLCEGVE